MTLPVVRVFRAVWVWIRSGCIKTSHPFLVGITGSVFIGFIIQVIKVIERSMFVVYASIQDGYNNTFTVEALLICCVGIGVRRHGLGGLRCNSVEGNHHVLHFNHDNSFEMINVHERTHWDFIQDDCIQRIQHLIPCTLFFSNPSVMVKDGVQLIEFFRLRTPGIINDDGDGLSSIITEDRRWRDGVLTIHYTLQSVIHSVPVQIWPVCKPPHRIFR